MKVGRFLSPYVRTADVKRAQTVTVAAVEEEVIGQGEDRKPKLVAYFDELEQGAVLGAKVVLSFFAEEFGEDSDDWIGKKVVMYKDPTITFQGKRVGGIRFKLVEEEGEKEEDGGTK